MASLSDEEMLNRIKSPKNKHFLELAAFQEERLILHGEPILEKYNLPFTAYRNFTGWWQSIISQVKYERIDSLLSCPFFTTGVVKDIFDQLQKFIDAQDRYVEFKFTDRDYTDDYNDFLQSKNDDTFWRQRILSELRTGICSYIVVDCPEKQVTERPEPYKYFIPPRLGIDVDLNQYSGKIEYFIYRQSDFKWNDSAVALNTNSRFSLINLDEDIQKIIGIDDDYYRVYIKRKKVDKRMKFQDWELYSKVPHNLGYCPVIDFWQDSIKGTNGINKIGPLTLQVSNLDYLLFFKACIDYMNLYGPFPVVTTYDMQPAGSEWDSKTKEVNMNSAGGMGLDQSRMSPVSNAAQTQNPRDSGRDMIGPGGGFKVPVPADATDHDMMKNAIKFVGMDSMSIDTANKLLEHFEAFIKEKCTGIDEDYLNEIAKNAEMYSASFRKEETILTWIKSNVERVHRFVTNATCELRYGKDYYNGCVIDYGSDYLLKDATTLSDEFKKSMDNGMPQGYSYDLSKTAILTRYKNNPEKIARLLILLDLEPYPNFDYKTMQLLQLDKLDVEQFKIKVNFVDFIARFENETGVSICDFGSLIPYSEKIKIIKSKLQEYGREQKWIELGQADPTPPKK